MRGERRGIDNRLPIIQGRELDSNTAYQGDIYDKGACVLHSLRWLLGDDAFFALLYRFATDPEHQYRLTSSAEFEAAAAQAAGRDLGWFFDRYLRRAELPRWRFERLPAGAAERLVLHWQEPGFELPLEVLTVDGYRRVEMPGGRGEIEVAAGARVLIDPRGWALAEGDVF
jgi:hypothetical protein